MSRYTGWVVSRWQIDVGGRLAALMLVMLLVAAILVLSAPPAQAHHYGSVVNGEKYGAVRVRMQYVPERSGWKSVKAEFGQYSGSRGGTSSNSKWVFLEGKHEFVDVGGSRDGGAGLSIQDEYTNMLCYPSSWKHCITAKSTYKVLEPMYRDHKGDYVRGTTTTRTVHKDSTASDPNWFETDGVIRFYSTNRTQGN